MLITVTVGVSYDRDLEKVEGVTLDVARRIMQEVAVDVREYQPFMRYTRFDYYSINFIVYLKVQEYFDQLVVKHEFIKVLHKKYQQEGIKLAFPIQGYYWPKQNNLDEQEVFRNELN